MTSLSCTAGARLWGLPVCDRPSMPTFHEYLELEKNNLTFPISFQINSRRVREFSNFGIWMKRPAESKVVTLKPQMLGSWNNKTK